MLVVLNTRSSCFIQLSLVQAASAVFNSTKYLQAAAKYHHITEEDFLVLTGRLCFWLRTMVNVHECCGTAGLLPKPPSIPCCWSSCISGVPGKGRGGCKKHRRSLCNISSVYQPCSIYLYIMSICVCAACCASLVLCVHWPVCVCKLFVSWLPVCPNILIH